MEAENGSYVRAAQDQPGQILRIKNIENRKRQQKETMSTI
jgi:hypothetical protein